MNKVMGSALTFLLCAGTFANATFEKANELLLQQQYLEEGPLGNRTLGPPLENNPEIPPSSRDEGLRLLHGLETNLATSLQTPQEA